MRIDIGYHTPKPTVNNRYQIHQILLCKQVAVRLKIEKKLDDTTSEASRDDEQVEDISSPVRMPNLSMDSMMVVDEISLTEMNSPPASFPSYSNSDNSSLSSRSFAPSPIIRRNNR